MLNLVRKGEHKRVPLKSSDKTAEDKLMKATEKAKAAKAAAKTDEEKVRLVFSIMHRERKKTTQTHSSPSSQSCSSEGRVNLIFFEAGFVRRFCSHRRQATAMRALSMLDLWIYSSSVENTRVDSP